LGQSNHDRLENIQVLDSTNLLSLTSINLSMIKVIFLLALYDSLLKLTLIDRVER
jgi:hypothetical protein